VWNGSSLNTLMAKEIVWIQIICIKFNKLSIEK